MEAEARKGHLDPEKEKFWREKRVPDQRPCISTSDN